MLMLSGVDNRGMGMINIQLLIDSKRNKIPYRILPVLLNVSVSLDCPFLIAPSVFSSIYLYEQVESWNDIGKYWFLRNLDTKFNGKIFVCKYSNVSILNLMIVPNFYEICI